MAFAVAATLFILYSNAAVVLARQFGLPSVLGGLPLAALLLLAGHRVLVRGQPVRCPPALVAAMLFGLIGLVAATQSKAPMASVVSALGFIAEGFLCALLVVNVLRDRHEVRAAIQGLVLAGGVMGAVALAHQLLGPDTTSFWGFSQVDAAMTADDGRIQRRLAGPVGETNRFAQIMVVVLPLALVLARVNLARVGRRALHLVCMLFSSVGLILTFSRGALVAMALSLPVAILLGLVRLRQMLLMACLAAIAVVNLPSFAERLHSIGEVAAQAAGFGSAGLRGADGASRGRLTEMLATGLIFLEHPLLGAGPGMVPELYPEYARAVGGKVRAERRQAHNLYLEVAAETGILGLLALLACLGLTIGSLLQLRRLSRELDPELYELAGGLLLALTLLLATSLFLHASFIRYFWLLVGLSLATSALRPEPSLARVLDQLLATVVRDRERLQ